MLEGNGCRPSYNGDGYAIAYGLGRDSFNSGKNASFSMSVEENIQPCMTSKGPGAVAHSADVTEEELAFWRGVFETHRQLVTHSAKAKTDRQILKWLSDPHTDAAEYKMWGNGVALPCVQWIMQQIVRVVEDSDD